MMTPTVAGAGGAALADGVYTASAGNMAQGVAWRARASSATILRGDIPSQEH